MYIKVSFDISSERGVGVFPRAEKVLVALLYMYILKIKLIHRSKSECRIK